MAAAFNLAAAGLALAGDRVRRCPMRGRRGRAVRRRQRAGPSTAGRGCPVRRHPAGARGRLVPLRAAVRARQQPELRDHARGGAGRYRRWARWRRPAGWDVARRITRWPPLVALLAATGLYAPPIAGSAVPATARPLLRGASSCHSLWLMLPTERCSRASCTRSSAARSRHRSATSRVPLSRLTLEQHAGRDAEPRRRAVSCSCPPRAWKRRSSPRPRLTVASRCAAARPARGSLRCAAVDSRAPRAARFAALFPFSLMRDQFQPLRAALARATSRRCSRSAQARPGLAR